MRIMTNWQPAITFLLTIGALFSAVRYARCKLTPPTKIALIILRTAWIIGLILAFWEPTIRFERFESGRMKIPVLIDASVSMQNFSPNDHVIPFIDTLSSLQSKTNGRVSFEYFLFGDSARAHPPSTPPRFVDTKSFFPNALNETDGRFSSDMIIVSDGHWTGARRTSDIFPRNTMHYLVLPEARPNPFVTLSHSAPETSPSDSMFTVDISASGYVRDNGALTVSLKESDRVIKTETIDIEHGYFSQSIKIRTSNRQPGRRLYRIEAAIDTSIPPSVSSFVHQTIPHFLTYSMYSATPTLDRRYITNALLSNDFFKEKTSSPDILFLFDWDTTAARMIRNLPRHAVAVFAGNLPCAANGVAAPSVTVRQVVEGGDVLGAGIDPRNIPPPQEIVACGQLPVSGIRRLLQASVNQTGAGQQQQPVTTSNNPSPNNFNILFTGRFMGRQSLFCPVKGIWRWDFWPMSSDRAENELFGFSNVLMSLAKEMLFDNIADQLIMYPAGDLTETDSARFMMSLPAAVPIFEPLKISVRINGDGVSIDTAMSYLPQGLNKQPLSFPALPPGRYGISSALDGGGIKAAFSDSFTVNKDMSELSVMSQNTQYLQEFAQPLDMRQWDGVSAMFDAWDQRSAERFTVAETIRLHKSWLLLGIVLSLLAVELVLRRIKGVD